MTRLNRYGYHLMSLASIAQLVAVGGWALQMFRLGRAVAAPGSPVAAHTALPIEFFGARVAPLLTDAHPAIPVAALALALVPSLIAAWWPWFQLRRFGKALYRQAPLSSAVARSLQWLGYALAGSAILTIIATPVAAAILTHGEVVSVGLGSLFFVLLVAAICAFSMALIVREAVRVADENREFV